MPASIAVVHNQIEFVDQVAAALLLAGHDTVVFTDPAVALDAFAEGEEFDVLITRVNYGPGRPNGVALARMARSKCRGIQVVFTARREYVENVSDLGELIPHPVNLSALVAAVNRAVTVKRLAEP